MKAVEATDEEWGEIVERLMNFKCAEIHADLFREANDLIEIGANTPATKLINAE